MGFKKPLEIQFRWRNALPELLSAIKTTIDEVFKRKTGSFRRSWQLSHLHVLRHSREGVEINNPHPAALALDEGAYIPTRYPIRAKALHWVDENGNDVFVKKAEGFYLEGRDYINKAVDKWGGKGLAVEWKEF